MPFFYYFAGKTIIMFNTNRNLLKFVLLSIVTLGIYGLVMMYHISKEINVAASPHDGKHTMNFLLIFFIFSWLTFGIAALIWYHRISNRIGGEVVRRGSYYQFGAEDFWLWSILGSLIIVGPYIYMHKLLKSMNIINIDYLKDRQ